MSKTFWQGFQEFLGFKRNITQEKAESIRPLEDADYEFLFAQLLEGVAHGWQPQRVQRFFEQLGEQGNHVPWIDWLKRFAAQVLNSPDPDLELADRLVLLAHQTQHLPKIVEIGAMSNAIAQELQRQAKTNTIWEYDGADAVPPNSPTAPQTEQQIVLTFEELAQRLQQDENLARQIARQLDLDNAQPQAILQALHQRLQNQEE